MSDKLMILESGEINPIVTLRDQFAMAALTGMLTDTRNGDDHESEIACMAYAYADAMLEAREQ